MWIEPERTGLFLGQCAKYCGTQHAKMLLRVYVDTPEDFDRWVKAQKEERRKIQRWRRGVWFSSERPASIAMRSRAPLPTADSGRT
jgi:heme/copper-type cytochrome/quinol oxidase subunit 2